MQPHPEPNAADFAIQRYSKQQNARINALRKIRGALHLQSPGKKTFGSELRRIGLTPRFAVVATALSCLHGLTVYCLLTCLKIG